MRSALATTLALGALALTTPASGLAQELASGTWTGTITPPDGPTLEVRYEVSTAEDGTLELSIVPPAEVGIGPFPADRVRFEEGRLTFSWDAAGTPLECELLEQEDGTIAGECVDPAGVPGHLTMVPPGEDERADPGDPGSPS